MGIPICMTALPPSDVVVVRQEMRKLAARFEPAGAAKGLEHNLVLARNDNGSITIIYPKAFDDCDEASARLSRSLKSPAFSFKLDNNDTNWAYKLFVNGAEVDRFSPWEDYFREAEDDKSGRRYAGNPGVVVSTWRAGSVAGIEKYYGFVSQKNCRLKAYPADEFPQCDEWQLVDFMAKLGIQYPIDGKGRVRGDQFTFRWR